MRPTPIRMDTRTIILVTRPIFMLSSTGLSTILMDILMMKIMGDAKASSKLALSPSEGSPNKLWIEPLRIHLNFDVVHR